MGAIRIECFFYLELLFIEHTGTLGCVREKNRCVWVLLLARGSLIRVEVKGVSSSLAASFPGWQSKHERLETYMKVNKL